MNWSTTEVVVEEWEMHQLKSNVELGYVYRLGMREREKKRAITHAHWIII